MMTFMSRGVALTIALGIGGAVAAGGALAHNEPMPKGKMTPAAHAAHMRHENFEKLGAAFKAVIDETKKSDPDKALVQKSTKIMTTLATALPTWFPRGSGVEARPKSEAKANIWTDAAGFTAAASAAQLQVSKLNQAALSGDMGAVRAQIRATGGSCKGCHDKYRQEKKD
jgi:cytochrome c556